MKTYITYKNQIEGFQDVVETVKTTEKIAASSVHFLKNEVANLNEYANHAENVLARLSVFYQKKSHPLLKAHSIGEKALIIITADKGLVGGLWHNTVNAFLRVSGDYRSVIILGAKGKNYLEEENIAVRKSFSGFTGVPSQEGVNELADYIFNGFSEENFAKVDILYPRFISLAEQEPAIIPFLPFEFIVNGKNVKKYPEKNPGLPIFEPLKKEVFARLLQKYIGMYLHKITLEAKLSELSARTVAMEHASAKTKEFIRMLTVSFRKDRRRVVAQRQLESFAAHKTI